MKGRIVGELHDFFHNLRENYSEAHATKVVRTTTGIALRNDDEIVELPSCFSKRQLYCKFLYECGWVVKPKGNGSFGPIKEYDLQKDGDDWVGTDENRIAPCSFSTFCIFWHKNFPKLQIRLPAYDTCATCFKFSCNLSAIHRKARENDIILNLNDLHLGGSVEVEQGQETDLELLDVPTTTNRSNKDKSDNEYSSDDSDEGSSLSSAQQMSDEDDGSSMLVVDDVSSDGSEQDLNDERDKVVAEMYAHTTAWNTQRDYVQKRMDEVKTDLVNGVSWPDRRDMFVCDYAQNMDLLHFGGEQPGDVYYFSPLNINVFGCCDYSTEHMQTFIYNKGEGKRGGNNVVSLLDQALGNKGVLKNAQENGPGEYLTLVFDNCGGQNKNRMVLRYLLYLVEKKVYKTVEAVFLVAGHTKNVCDCLFKQLKRGFHYKNVYTMNQLIRVCNISDSITPIHCSSNNFFNWDLYLDRIYKRPGAGTVNKNHIFKSVQTKPGILITEIIKDEDVKEQNLIKLSKNETGGQKSGRARIINGKKLKNEKRPGLRDIKQVDLYEKWGPLVPAQFRDEICPKPSNKIIKSVKEERKAKMNTKQHK